MKKLIDLATDPEQYSDGRAATVINKITLIGMPSAGKSTIGYALANRLDFDFMDLDHMVEVKEGMDLIEVMNKKGADYFRNMEYDLIKNIDIDKKVIISPAGSIIFQNEAMNWIKKNSFVVFLDTPLEIIEKRLKHKPKAVAGLAERGLKSIWEERMPIYSRYASVVIKTDNKELDAIVDEIIDSIK